MRLKNNNNSNTPSPKSFGIVFGALFILIEIYLNFFKDIFLFYLYLIGIVILSIAFLKPNLLSIPNLIWFRFGIILSKITNPIILFIIFYFIIFPYSLLIKIFKGSILNKKFNFSNKTYWEKRETKINSMKDQY